MDTVINTHIHYDRVGWNTHLVDQAFVPTNMRPAETEDEKRRFEGIRFVFTNPTTRIHIGRRNQHVPRPLIGVHALWPKQVRHLLLDDIDLPNLRFRFDGTVHALDPLTASAISDYLTYRRACRPPLPSCAKTASSTRPAPPAPTPYT